MDRGAWQAIVHGVTQSQTRVTNTHTHTHTHTFFAMVRFGRILDYVFLEEDDSRQREQMEQGL